MNYQFEVRKKIESYPVRELIIASRFLKEELQHIPANAYYKSIERMIGTGKLERVAKGIYCRPKVTKFGKISAGEENILNYYIGKGKCTGVIVGYRLYNKYGITTQVSKRVKVYSNVLDEDRRVIENIEIKKINMHINLRIKKAIELLEILQNYNEIEDINENNFRHFCITAIREYSDEVFINVLKNMKYKKKTIAYLESILNSNRVENTLSQFLNKTSKYKIPVVEEFYEPAY